MSKRQMTSSVGIQRLYCIVTACLVMAALATGCGSAGLAQDSEASQPEPTTVQAPATEASQPEPTTVQAPATEASQPEPTAEQAPATEASQPEPTTEAALPELAYTANAITVTFEGLQCVNHGSLSVKAGRVALILDATDRPPGRSAYRVTVFTVDEGKTLEDIRNWKSEHGNAPLWVHMQGAVEAMPGTSVESGATLFNGPIYLACFPAGHENPTDYLGPIDVDPPSN